MQRKVTVYTIDAFAKTGEASTGNPAGFVLLKDFSSISKVKLENLETSDRPELTEEDMRSVAAAVGFSETAFLDRSDKADFKVRFFTPNDEVDLCGHATIGTFSGLFQLGLVGPGTYTQETKAGVLTVQIHEDGKVLMAQASPVMGDVYTAQQLATSLGLSPDDIRTYLSCQAVSTGLLDILIPVKSVEVLERIKADDEAITKISRDLNVGGYHVFALTENEQEAGENLTKGLPLTARCRNFAPIYEIPEEAATGTSSGALTAYLKQHWSPEAKAYVFTQGVEMGQPSQIETQVDAAGNILVGGTACHLDKREVLIGAEVGQ